MPLRNKTKYVRAHFLFPNVKKTISSAGFKTSTSELSREISSSRNSEQQSRHPFIVSKLTNGVDNRNLQGLLAHFRACGNYQHLITEKCTRPKKVPLKTEPVDQTPTIFPDCLDPSSHQRLSVLFCSFLYCGNRLVKYSNHLNSWTIHFSVKKIIFNIWQIWVLKVIHHEFWDFETFFIPKLKIILSISWKIYVNVYI